MADIAQESFKKRKHTIKPFYNCEKGKANYEMVFGCGVQKKG